MVVDELVTCTFEVVVAGSTRVPPVGATSLRECSRPFHERDALALDRPCDERVRALVHRTERRERFAKLPVVVTVARAHVPSERTQLLLEIAERDDLLGELVRLQLVAIDDDPQRASASWAAACIASQFWPS